MGGKYAFGPFRSILISSPFPHCLFSLIFKSYYHVSKSNLGIASILYISYLIPLACHNQMKQVTSK